MRKGTCMQTVQGQYLHAYLRSLEDALEHTIQTTADTQLLSSNEDSYIDSLIQKYTVIPIQLHLEQAEITMHQKQMSARDLAPNIRFGRGINPNDPRPLFQNALVCHLPFSGDAKLFQYDPASSCRMSLPKLTIGNSEISFEVIYHENQPDEAGNTINRYKGWIQQQAGYINNDLAPYNASLENRIQRSINKKKQEANKLSEVLSNIGVPLRKTQELNQKNLTTAITHEVSDAYYSVAISYGGLDEIVATKLNNFLESHGVKTWFYPDDGLAGEKLHRMMSKMVKQADRIILLCSQSSLQRAGVLNELERTLEKEAKEGASEILIPIALDDYVYDKWTPKNADWADQVRTRNILEFNAANWDSEKIQKQLMKLLLSLTKK